VNDDILSVSSIGSMGLKRQGRPQQEGFDLDGIIENSADFESFETRGLPGGEETKVTAIGDDFKDAADADDSEEWSSVTWEERHQWDAEPGVGRMVSRIPHSVERIRCLGNAVVPQVAEVIGRMIMAVEAMQ
jgi:hypothetical protein